jgi:hypothetical protein
VYARIQAEAQRRGERIDELLDLAEAGYRFELAACIKRVDSDNAWELRPLEAGDLKRRALAAGLAPAQVEVAASSTAALIGLIRGAQAQELAAKSVQQVLVLLGCNGDPNTAAYRGGSTAYDALVADVQPGQPPAPEAFFAQVTAAAELDLAALQRRPASWRATPQRVLPIDVLGVRTLLTGPSIARLMRDLPPARAYLHSKRFWLRPAGAKYKKEAKSALARTDDSSASSALDNAFGSEYMHEDSSLLRNVLRYLRRGDPRVLTAGGLRRAPASRDSESASVTDSTTAGGEQDAGGAAARDGASDMDVEVESLHLDWHHPFTLPAVEEWPQRGASRRQRMGVFYVPDTEAGAVVLGTLARVPTTTDVDNASILHSQLHVRRLSPHHFAPGRALSARASPSWSVFKHNSWVLPDSGAEHPEAIETNCIIHDCVLTEDNSRSTREVDDADLRAAVERAEEYEQALDDLALAEERREEVAASRAMEEDEAAKTAAIATATTATATEAEAEQPMEEEPASEAQPKDNIAEMLDGSCSVQ